MLPFFQSDCITYIHTRYMHVHQASRGAHGKFEMVKLEALARRRHAVLRLSIDESASEVNCSGGDTPVVSCHGYLVVFHPFLFSS